MTDYIIATSSTSDLPRTWLEAHGVPFIPYTYSIGETVFEDDCREESRQKVYEGMRKGDFLKTAMINEFEYEEFFRSLMQEGRNVIFLDMSREMSSSFVNAGLAAEIIREEFPEQTLYIMDTLHKTVNNVQFTAIFVKVLTGDPHNEIIPQCFSPL